MGYDNPAMTVLCVRLEMLIGPRHVATQHPPRRTETNKVHGVAGNTSPSCGKIRICEVTPVNSLHFNPAQLRRYHAKKFFGKERVSFVAAFSQTISQNVLS